MTVTAPARRLVIATFVSMLLVLAVAEAARAAAPVIVNSGSRDNWLESFSSVGEGSNATTSREIWFTLVVKHDNGEPPTGVKIDQDLDGSWNNPGATLTDITRQQVNGNYTYTRLTGFFRKTGTVSGYGCPTVGSGTRQLDRTVRLKATNADGDSNEVNGTVNFSTASDCYLREDYPFVYDRSQSATNVAPNATVNFTYRGDDPDTDTYQGFAYRWRNLETGTATSYTNRCGEGTYGGDNTSRTTGIQVPSTRGRYVLEARLFSNDGCSTSHDKIWRMGAVDVNSTSQPTVNLSSFPSRVGGPSPSAINLTATTTDDDQIDILDWDLDNNTSTGTDGYEIRHHNTPTSGWPGAVASADKSKSINVAELPEGSRTIRVRAWDSGALTAADDSARTATDSVTFTVDKTAPSPTVTAPTGTITTGTPTLSGAAGNATGDNTTVTVELFEGATASGAPLRSATRTRSGATWTWPQTEALADGQYTVRVTQADDVGNTASSTGSFSIDTTAPDVTILTGPGNFSKQAEREATFTFESDDESATVECRVDGGAWSGCVSPVTMSDLADGSHTFQVRATDAVGNRDSDSRTFLVGGANVPACTVTGADPGEVNGTTGADVICLGPGAHTVNAGPGNDTVFGGPDNDTIDGGTGNDALFGGGGDDTLNGGADDAGTDRLSGGPGSDTFNGGPGIDRALYDDHTAGVTVTIDGVANDGSAGESDNVGTDVESITGSEETDSITGSGSNNTFSGRAGDDDLNGAGGDDFMGGSEDGAHDFDGGEGVDRVTYTHYPASSPVTVSLDGQANDGANGENDNVGSSVEYVYGTPGDDTITAPEDHETGISFWGYDGNDTLIGGAGADALYGMGGQDTLNGRAGHDILRGGADADDNTCGDGDDQYEADASDTVASDCETPIVPLP